MIARVGNFVMVWNGISARAIKFRDHTAARNWLGGSGMTVIGWRRFVADYGDPRPQATIAA